MRVLFLLLLLVPTILFGGITPTGFVNDYANLLNTEQVYQLESKVSNFEKKTDIEIAVAIVTSLDGNDIDTYKNSLFRQWGVGKAGRNNGLLVVISPNDRKWGIEIGYGLEPYLTDYTSYDMAETHLVPNFKAGNYYQGLDELISVMTKHLGTSTWKDRVAYTKAQKEKEQREHEESVRTFFQVLLWIVAIIGLTIAFFFFKRKQEREKAFKKNREDKANNYKTKVSEVSSELYKLRGESIELDKNMVNLIKSSTVENLNTNYNVALDSIRPQVTLINTINNINDSVFTAISLLNDITKLEKKHNIESGNKLDFDFNPKSDIQELENRLYIIDGIKSTFETRKNKLERFDNLVSLHPQSLVNDIESYKSEFTNKFYKPSNNDLISLVERLNDSINVFNRADVSFGNLYNLEKSHNDIKKCKQDISNHLDIIRSRNTEHEKMVSVLNGSTQNLSSVSSKLNSYLNNSDVNSSTKTAIRSILPTLLAFSVTSNILDSFNNYNSLVSKANSLLKKAKSEVEEAEEDRARERRRLAAAAAAAASSYSSSSSSSSWGSSDSDSSWGGFGGGDSGGGGSSGDW
jgi:uncharacterized membrane protein YgcG